MYHRGGVRVPQHARARQHVFFEIVGVHLHQPGQQQIALEVDGMGQRAQPRPHVGDDTVTHPHMPQKRCVGGDYLGVVEQHFRQG